MTSGTWQSTPFLAKTVVVLILVGVAGLAVLGAWLWPILVVTAHIVGVVVTHLWAAAPWLAVFEVGVVVSAVLDFRDAQLACASKRHAWLVAHRTVWLRFGRRVRWVSGLVGVFAGQMVKTPTLDALHLAGRRDAVVWELDRAPSSERGAA